MLYAITATPIEMAAATILTGWQPDALRHPGPLDRLLACKHHRAGLVALGGWCFIVGASTVVTDDTVNVVLIAKVERIVLPAITGMTLGAHTLVTAGISAECVDQVFLAQCLAGLLVLVSPGPMYVFHELAAGFGVTLQAGPGDLGTAREGTFQFIKFGVIGSRVGVCTLSRLCHYRIQTIVHIGVHFSDRLSVFTRSLCDEYREKQQ